MQTSFWSKSVSCGFRSVVVITSALHAEGRRFEPCRKHFFFQLFFFFLFTGSTGFLSGLSSLSSRHGGQYRPLRNYNRLPRIEVATFWFYANSLFYLFHLTLL